VDNFTFHAEIKYLLKAQSCGLDPVAVVLQTGITSKNFEILWISVFYAAIYSQVSLHSDVTQF